MSNPSIEDLRVEEADITFAFEEGDLEALETIINTGLWELSQPIDDRGNTILHLGSEKGYSEVVAWCYDNDAFLEHKNNDGQTCLAVALINGQDETVELLLSLGASVKAVDNNGVYIEHYGSRFANVEFLKDIQSKGILFGKRDNERKTCLHYACCSDNVECVEFLYNTICLPLNAVDSKGMTPLHAAITFDCVNVIKFLIKAGADVNWKVGSMSPLFLAGYLDKPHLLPLLSRKNPSEIRFTFTFKQFSTLFEEFPSLNVLRDTYGCEISSKNRSVYISISFLSFLKISNADHCLGKLGYLQERFRDLDVSDIAIPQVYSSLLFQPPSSFCDFFKLNSPNMNLCFDLDMILNIVVESPRWRKVIDLVGYLVGLRITPLDLVAIDNTPAINNMLVEFIAENFSESLLVGFDHAHSVSDYFTDATIMQSLFIAELSHSQFFINDFSACILSIDPELLNRMKDTVIIHNEMTYNDLVAICEEKGLELDGLEKVYKAMDIPMTENRKRIAKTLKISTVAPDATDSPVATDTPRTKKRKKRRRKQKKWWLRYSSVTSS
ncbi:hypothetical protein PCE1_003029 [Barthelona sp. PCE]